MSQWRIYHNPKCSKSREALELLRQNRIEPEIIEYLKTPLTEADLVDLMTKLDAPSSVLVRTKEEDFQNAPFDINAGGEIVKHLTKNPKLLERPIVTYGDRAVVGRPLENIQKLISPRD